MTNLDIFNSSLRALREAFHKSGRFNDSNAKLDEISKLLAIQLYEITYPQESWIQKSLSDYQKNGSDLVQALKKRFSQIANDSIFITYDGVNIFGDRPEIDLTDLDDDFAFQMLSLIVNSFDGIKNRGERFDFLNEAFGHFVRDNFRSNVEDAQYMTPQEVVDLMCDIAYHEISPGGLKDLVVCDPCCGVGSFISSFYRRAKEGHSKVRLELLGQDKVPRMIRFAKLNLDLSPLAKHKVASGNSLVGDTLLDEYEGKVDLILTNPPFGARFKASELASERPSKFPLLHDLFESNLNFSSEILFVDRCVGLLKDGGHMLAVVPDSVISSKGVAESLRHRIINSTNLQLVSLIELPTVTFAQAGTRTKTTILHFKKSKAKKEAPVFIAKSNSLGFEVSTRKGVNVKLQEGENDLPKIFQHYLKSKSSTTRVDQHKIIGKNPSSVIINSKLLQEKPWTPNHYEATKFQTLDSFKKRSDFELTPLNELAEVLTDIRRKDKKEPDSKCISVLHVVNSDLLDYQELMNYSPKYPGIVCKSGDLLFSKINPRIPRVIVVPDLGINLTCSSEFEILRAKSGLSNYDLKMLLLLPSVQVQINHLTSGTSSSHNRIKTRELMNIMIPIPKKETKVGKEFLRMLTESKKVYKNALLLNIDKARLSQSMSDLIQIPD